MEVDSFQRSSQIWNLLPLGKAMHEPAPGRTHLRIHPASNSDIPSTKSDCLPCARTRENINKQSSHTNRVSGFQFRAWKAGSGIPREDHRLGESRGDCDHPRPQGAHLSGSIIHYPEEAGVPPCGITGTQETLIVSHIGNSRLVPSTLPYQRSCPWFCLWYRASSRPLFLWIRSLALRFWNQI